jgi:hypothetical protein
MAHCQLPQRVRNPSLYNTGREGSNVWKNEKLIVIHILTNTSAMEGMDLKAWAFVSARTVAESYPACVMNV